MPLRNVRGHEDFKGLVLTRVNQLDKPVVSEGSPSLVSRDELMSIKAQLIDLTFLHDVEYFLNKQNLSYAEVWFFDGSETFDANNLVIDSTNKKLKNYEVIGDFEVDWDGWNVVTSGGNVAERITTWSISGSYSAGGRMPSTGVGSTTMTKSVDVSVFNSLRVWYKLYNSLAGRTAKISIYVGGNLVYSDDITNTAQTKITEAVIDISQYTGLQEIKIVMSLAYQNSCYVDYIRLESEGGYVSKQLSQGPISDVMIILNDADAAKLGTDVRVYVDDGVNTVEITQNKTLTAVNLNSLNVKLEMPNPDTELDNFAILWR